MTFASTILHATHSYCGFVVSLLSQENWQPLIHAQEKDVLDWAACVNNNRLVLCYLHDVKVRFHRSPCLELVSCKFSCMYEYSVAVWANAHVHVHVHQDTTDRYCNIVSAQRATGTFYIHMQIIIFTRVDCMYMTYVLLRVSCTCTTWRQASDSRRFRSTSAASSATPARRKTPRYLFTEEFPPPPHPFPQFLVNWELFVNQGRSKR